MSLRFLLLRMVCGPAAERFWRLLAFAFMAVVAGLALSPSPPPIADTGWDKLNHLLAFTSLAACSRLGFPGPASRALLVAAGLIAFGGAIELLQPLVGGRMREWADLLADVIGTGIGIALADALRRLTGSGERGRARAQALGR